MARIRTIKPDFFRHEELFEAEKSSGLPLRLAYAGLWTVADRRGRFRWKPRVLVLDILPFDNVDFGEVLDALAASGFLIKYQVGPDIFGCIPTFAEHQHVNVREPESNLPSPDEAGASMCAHVPRARAKEGEGEGEKEREDSIRQSGASTCENIPAPSRSEFDATFWPAYPHKVGKVDAKRAFSKARAKHPLDAIMAGLAAYKRDKPADRQWLNPATFLNGERFHDDPDYTPAGGNGRAGQPQGSILAAVASVLADVDPDGGEPGLPPRRDDDHPGPTIDHRDDDRDLEIPPSLRRYP